MFQISWSFLVLSEQEKGTGERWWVEEDKEVALNDGEASSNHPPMCISENLIDMSVSADSLLAFNSSIIFKYTSKQTHYLKRYFLKFCLNF